MFRRRTLRTVTQGVMFAFAGLICSASVQASQTIDDFSSTTAGWPMTQVGVGSTPVSESVVVIGGTRDTTIEVTSVLPPPGLDSLTAGIFSGAGLLDFASAANIFGELTLDYPAASADFTLEDRISIALLDFDNANNGDMPVTVTLNDGTSVYNRTILITTNGAQTIDFPFVSFALQSGPGPLDLSDVDQITVHFDAPQGADFRIDHITAVPEPASLILMGASSVVMLLRRRRR